MSINSESVIQDALAKAFYLGQLYWEYADSEFVSYNKKADATKGKFDELVVMTIDQIRGIEDAQSEGE